MLPSAGVLCSRAVSTDVYAHVLAANLLQPFSDLGVLGCLIIGICSVLIGRRLTNQM